MNKVRNILVALIASSLMIASTLTANAGEMAVNKEKLNNCVIVDADYIKYITKVVTSKGYDSADLLIGQEASNFAKVFSKMTGENVVGSIGFLVFTDFDGGAATVVLPLNKIMQACTMFKLSLGDALALMVVARG